MEYVDLNTGFYLMGFPDYGEFKRIKQLCQDRYKHIAFAGEFGYMHEIQAKRWARSVPSGYQNYALSLDDYYNSDYIKPRPERIPKGLKSIETAIQELERKAQYKVRYVLIVRK
ncbi:hypothetical protein CLV24_1781 [Pontibacter ummariensis]|uniref:Uncharacterized protein n=1 Tax=Pontibacter ummariensis TaxID=1610492 RepID=A0A239M648_9BACT|nr:hypothetical protein [Pontibacter ummariensis]PRX96962.1 hypothetical protein CLV24_1781 [Pontibacter ummariensis]SNT37593.1 hypothetical protein SAMN06296052_1761 [Pontibacter ummariensis]